MPKNKITAESLDEILDSGFTQRQIESFHSEIYSNMESSGISIIEAIADYCEERGIEPDILTPLINKDPRMLSDISEEARSRNMLKKSRKHQKLDLS